MPTLNYFLVFWSGVFNGENKFVCMLSVWDISLH